MSGRLHSYEKYFSTGSIIPPKPDNLSSIVNASIFQAFRGFTYQEKAFKCFGSYFQSNQAERFSGKNKRAVYNIGQPNNLDDYIETLFDPHQIVLFAGNSTMGSSKISHMLDGTIRLIGDVNESEIQSIREQRLEKLNQEFAEWSNKSLIFLNSTSKFEQFSGFRKSLYVKEKRFQLEKYLPLDSGFFVGVLEPSQNLELEKKRIQIDLNDSVGVFKRVQDVILENAFEEVDLEIIAPSLFVESYFLNCLQQRNQFLLSTLSSNSLVFGQCIEGRLLDAISRIKPNRGLQIINLLGLPRIEIWSIKFRDF